MASLLMGRIEGRTNRKNLNDESKKTFSLDVADGVGFEPTRELPLCRFSRPVP
jgi:hypothetical protein